MPRRRMKVLVVEDNDDLRGLFRTALAIDGFEVQEARNGLDALHRIDQDPPDIVVLDINLPLVSGVAVREQIAAHSATRHMPVVVVTGSAENFDALNVPCIIRKPVSPTELVKAVRKCLASGGGVAAY
jgi:twitching motility two-component system response regulator PilH